MIEQAPQGLEGRLDDRVASPPAGHHAEHFYVRQVAKSVLKAGNCRSANLRIEMDDDPVLWPRDRPDQPLGVTELAVSQDGKAQSYVGCATPHGRLPPSRPHSLCRSSGYPQGGSSPPVPMLGNSWRKR